MNIEEGKGKGKQMCEYLVPDVLKPNLEIVFCGTALGHRSARDKAYYAHSGNKFWKTLYEFGFTPYLVEPLNYRAVAQWGIGLTDMCKTHSGNDKDIHSDYYDPKALTAKILKYQPKILAFTSKKAAQIFLYAQHTGLIQYGLQNQMIEHTKLFVLPSPSGHATRYWTSKPWEELKILSDQLKT